MPRKHLFTASQASGYLRLNLFLSFCLSEVFLESTASDTTRLAAAASSPPPTRSHTAPQHVEKYASSPSGNSTEAAATT